MVSFSELTTCPKPRSLTVDDIGNLFIICEGNGTYTRVKFPLSEVWKAKNVMDTAWDQSSLGESCQILRIYYEAG